MIELKVRLATKNDAEIISALIGRALRETNATDYSPAIIDRVVGNFTPSRICELIEGREVFVGLENGVIVGTASLDDSVVRTMFVNPDNQMQGVGTRLMKHIEQRAASMNHKFLRVPSSVSAEGFYSKLGFVVVRDSFYGEERTILMKKSICAP